jgi:hypothetical protein
LKFGVPREDN